jgi:hypothetical protein
MMNDRRTMSVSPKDSHCLKRMVSYLTKRLQSRSKTPKKSDRTDKDGFRISNKWLRNVHMLFLAIAEHESNIEEVRSDLAALTAFSPI